MRAAVLATTEPVAEKFFALCDFFGYTQGDIAEWFDISQSAVSQWRGGLPDSRIDQFCRVFEVSLEEVRELSKDELIDLSAQRRRSAGDYVDSTDDLFDWIKRVGADPSVSASAETVLLALIPFLHDKKFIVPKGKQEIIEESGRSEELIDSAWSEVLDSGYVEMLGDRAIALRFPR